MAKRQIGIERLFNLGSFKNIRITEIVEVDDDKFSDAELDALRYLVVLNAYWTFGQHQKLTQMIANEEFETEAMLELIANERDTIIAEIVEAAKVKLEEEVE